MRPALTLKAKALQLLATRDHSRAEMERKLAQWLQQQARQAQERAAARGHFQTDSRPAERDFDDSPLPQELPCVESGDADAKADSHTEIARVLDDMTARGYLSEERAAQSLVHRRAGRMGDARLAQELRQRGLDATVIDATLAGLRAADDEPARAWAVWQRKFGSLPSSPQERARQTRFLASRGFRHDTIRQVLSGSLANPDGDGNTPCCTEDGPWL